ncbi:MAG TPA: ATP synthase F0 subunit B [Polyangiaceae bacterium]|jgi:F-type H+-transporting ATPase subunit b|nr:ATP synthase F0 subunit B [Polyangiaceae bacterium]
MWIAPSPSVPASGTAFDAVLGMSSGGWLDFDKTVIYQMVLFLALMLILKPLLFDPVLKVFALREERTEGARAQARELQERAGELLRQYESELARVHQVAAEERQHLRAETAKLEADILKQAREATGRIIEDGRKRIEEEVNGIRFDLGRESEKMSQQIVARVLGREVS